MGSKNIGEIVDTFLQDPAWGIDNVKQPEKKTLDSFKNTHDLPEDCIELLSKTDGFVLFHAGDYRMSDISWIMECRNDQTYGMRFQKEILEVGYFMEYNLVINLSQSHTQQYLYAGFACENDDFVCIGTITDFFNGFIAHAETDKYGDLTVNIPFWETENREKFDFENR